MKKTILTIALLGVLSLPIIATNDFNRTQWKIDLKEATQKVKTIDLLCIQNMRMCKKCVNKAKEYYTKMVNEDNISEKTEETFKEYQMRINKYCGKEI